MFVDFFSVAYSCKREKRNIDQIIFVFSKIDTLRNFFQKLEIRFKVFIDIEIREEDLSRNFQSILLSDLTGKSLLCSCV